MVRMTDRKPKWVVEKKEPAPKEKTETRNEQKVIPPIINEKAKEEEKKNKVQEPAVDINSIPKKRAPAVFSGPSALMPLQNICTQFNDGHYTYHVCPYKFIVQVENKNVGYRGCIGIWGQYLDSEQQEARLSFVDGDECPGNIDRQTELIISCDSEVESLQINAVNEREVCHYYIEASSSLVCGIDSQELSPHQEDSEVIIHEVTQDREDMKETIGETLQQEIRKELEEEIKQQVIRELKEEIRSHIRDVFIREHPHLKEHTDLSIPELYKQQVESIQNEIQQLERDLIDLQNEIEGLFM